MAEVKIYSTPTCPYCKMAKEYFDEKKVEYKDIDVSADPTAGEEMVNKSGQMGVPVIIITKDDGSEEIIVGFAQDKVNEILGL